MEIVNWKKGLDRMLSCKLKHNSAVHTTGDNVITRAMLANEKEGIYRKLHQSRGAKVKEDALSYGVNKGKINNILKTGERNTPGGKWDYWGKGSVPYDGSGFGGTNFVGSGPLGNPIESGLAPVDMIDYYAFSHDIEYFNKGIEGGYLEARFNTSVALADFRLVQGSIDVMNAYHQRKIDPITQHEVSQRTYNVARAVYSFYHKQVIYKYDKEFGVSPPFKY